MVGLGTFFQEKGGSLFRGPAVVVSLALGIMASYGQVSYTWTGAASSQWAMATNWTPLGVPGPLDNVLVQSAPNPLVLDSPRTITGFAITSGLMDLGGHAFTVTGSGNYIGGGITQGSLVLNAPVGAHAFNGALVGVSVNGTAASITFTGSTFQQPVSLNRTGPGNDVCAGTTIFQQPVSLVQAGTGIWSLAHIGNTRFEGGLQLACTGSGAIQFGGSGGTTLLPAGQTVSVGPMGFASGQLQFRNFIQQGSTSQTLLLTGTSQLSFQPGCSFEGTLTAAAPRIFPSGGTYFAPVRFTKTGAGSDNGAGGCTYHAPVQLHVSGPGTLNLASFGTDTYHGGVSVSCTGTGGIQFGIGTGSTVIPIGQAISIGAPGFISGQLQLSRIVQSGSAPQVLALSASAVLRFAGPNTFNGPVTAVAGRLFVQGSTFNGPVRLGKIGASVDASAGGNAFNGPLEVDLSGSGELQLHATGTDQFQSSITFSCSGTGAIRFGATSGSAVLAPGASMSSHPASFTSGTLELRGTMQLGNSAQNLAMGGTARGIIGQGCSFEGAVDVVAPSVLLNGGTFQAPLAVVKSGGGVDASTGGNTFNGPVDLTVTGPGALWLHSTGTDVFHGDIRVGSVGSGGVFFGMMGGSATLAAGRTVAVGPAGFNTGVLSFRNFQQVGNTAQNLALSGTALVRFDQGSSFGGDVTVISAGLLLDGAVFLGAFDAVRTASVVNLCRGGNTFHGSFRLRQLGSGDLIMAQLQPDTFLGPTWFQRIGSGALHVAYAQSARFGGHLRLDGTLLPVSFGNAGGGVEVIGTGPRDWTAPPSFPFQLPVLQLNGAGALVRLFADVAVSQSIAFLQGVVQPMASTSTSTGLLILDATCTITDPADDGSYADGWVRKAVTTSFTFPTGNGGAAAPFAVTVPAGPVELFTVRYRRSDPDPNWDTALKEPTLDHLSQCEYWEVDRSNGTTPVVVTLSWGTPRSCGVDWMADLRVARWDGSLWRDLGQGSVVGTFTSGTIVSGTAATAMGPFTLASSSLMNPLPVELLRFDAIDEVDHVRLEWATAQEQGAAAFEVERSADDRDYVAIAQVMAVGNSQQVSDYVAYDPDPLQGLSYYRLKMIDLDGSMEWGPVRTIHRRSHREFAVFPNPADELVWLTMEAEGGELVEVLDMTGATVVRTQLQVSADGPWLSVSDLSPGVYSVRVIAEGRVPFSARFMKR
jgi:hypothetical protein